MRTIKINKRDVLSTLLFCFILLEGLCNNIIITFLPLNNIFGFTLLGLCGFIIMCCSVKMKNWKVAFVLVILLVYCLEIIIYPSKQILQYLIAFLSFGFAGILCSCLFLDEKKILQYASIILLVNLLIFSIQKFSIIQMDYFSFGYMMLPGVLCSFLYSIELRKSKSYIGSILLLIITLWAAYVMFTNGGRGIYICLVIFIWLCFLLLTSNRLSQFLCVLAVPCSIVGFMNAKKIALILQKLLWDSNIKIYAIDKTVRLLTRTGDATNGRMELYSNVFKDLDFWTVIFGKGIAFYEVQFETYTHNVFLSIFSDFGLIGISVFCVLLFCLFRKIRQTENSSRRIYILLLSVCFTKLMMSSVYWKSSGFWVLIGLAMDKNVNGCVNSLKIPCNLEKGEKSSRVSLHA